MLVQAFYLSAKPGTPMRLVLDHVQEIVPWLSRGYKIYYILLYIIIYSKYTSNTSIYIIYIASWYWRASQHFTFESYQLYFIFVYIAKAAMVDSLNGLYTHVSVIGKWREIKASLRWWWPEDFPGDFSQQCSKSTLFQGLWMCAWMHAHVLAGSLLCDLLSWLLILGLLCQVVSQLYFHFGKIVLYFVAQKT